MSFRRRIAKFPQEISRALGMLSAHEHHQLVNMYERTRWLLSTDLENCSVQN
jgi:hypothetical protein